MIEKFSNISITKDITSPKHLYKIKNQNKTKETNHENQQGWRQHDFFITLHLGKITSSHKNMIK